MAKNIRKYKDFSPKIDKTCYIDESSVIIGDVEIGDNSSVWMCAVIRGDVNSIKIGKRSSIQDHVMLHVSHKNAEKPNGSPLIIGDDVTIGHSAVLHGCEIGDRVLVGIGSIVLDDAVIESDVIVAAASLVPPRKRLQSGYLYMGSPVRQIRALSDEEREFLKYSAGHYVGLAESYKK